MGEEVGAMEGSHASLLGLRELRFPNRRNDNHQNVVEMGEEEVEMGEEVVEMGEEVVEMGEEVGAMEGSHASLLGLRELRFPNRRNDNHQHFFSRLVEMGEEVVEMGEEEVEMGEEVVEMGEEVGAMEGSHASLLGLRELRFPNRRNDNHQHFFSRLVEMGEEVVEMGEEEVEMGEEVVEMGEEVVEMGEEVGAMEGSHASLLGLRELRFPNRRNDNHQYVVTSYHCRRPKIQEAHATIAIWDPKLARPNSDFSLSQIWIGAGSGSNVQTIEAGWQVYPRRTGTTRPQFFVFWTPNNYVTGTYDLDGEGWVGTHDTLYPGMSLPCSVYGSQLQQHELVLKIRREQNGDWSIFIGDSRIGYFPARIFNGGPLATHGANRVDWGGEIYDSSGSRGHHTLTQMGSGHFAQEGYGRASHIRNLYIRDSRRSRTLKQNKLVTSAPARNSYTYRFVQEITGLFFYYGGPGSN
ncbi:hypothetical protein Ancab_012675 [Ancistrocladus abbreviatus]